MMPPKKRFRGLITNGFLLIFKTEFFNPGLGNKHPSKGGPTVFNNKIFYGLLGKKPKRFSLVS